MSRWQYWSRGSKPGLGFSSFLAEAGRSMPGDPEQIAQQQGWIGKNYGWYQDSQGQIVARNIGGQMIVFDEPPNDAQVQPDMGNPTGAASGMKPADRAASMGLRSNGKGGYVDPETGQVKARTVNNELVFYDSGPGGGVVSDGAGGQNAAMDTPSWQDPTTGLVVVPPAKPETPAELAAVPDPVPPQAPQGFADFIQRSKLDKYKEDAARREAEQSKEALFARSPATKSFVDEMTPIIDKGLESGDAHRIRVSQKGKEMLENGLEDFADTFERYKNWHHDEDFKNAMKYRVAAQSRQAVHDEIIQEIMNDESLTDEEKQDKIEIANADEQTGPASWEKFQAAAEQNFGMFDRIDARQRQREEEERTQEYRGEFVTYTVKDGDFVDSIVDAAKESGYETNGEIREVSWTADDEGKENENRKAAAFDALRTWRQKVLPELEVGAIVVNYPDKGGRGGNQRERIYKMAGFGDIDPENDAQAGIVVADEQGNKRVVPVSGPEMAPRLRESVMQLIMAGEETDLLYEQLLA